MKNNKIAKIILIILCIASIYTYTKVEAKETCTIQEKNNLIQLAYNVKFDYELIDDKGEIGSNKLFALTISNLFDGIKIEDKAIIYRYEEDRETPGIVEMNEYYESGKTYTFSIYGDDNSACQDVFLLKKTITIPKYNHYSEREECVGIEEFKLCQRWYAGSFTEEEFKSQVQKYKDALNTQPEKTQKEEKENIITHLLRLYVNNLIISISLTIILLLIILIIIIKIIRNRKKVKIKF